MKCRKLTLLNRRVFGAGGGIRTSVPYTVDTVVGGSSPGQGRSPTMKGAQISLFRQGTPFVCAKYIRESATSQLVRRAKVKKGTLVRHFMLTANSGADEHGGKPRGVEAAKKQTLATLVSYESGAVVSRTIIDRRAGTVTLFAFDESEGLSEHTAAYDALLFVINGAANITISGVSNELKEGEAIVLPAGKPHSVRAVSKFKMMLVMIRE